MRDGAQIIREQHPELPDLPFEPFWNFCINAPIYEEGINNVFTVPHTDAKNGALLVCAIFTYYYGTGELTLFLLISTSIHSNPTSI